MKPTKQKTTQATRVAAVVNIIGQELGVDHQAALEAYAADHGKDWARQLMDDWYTGRDVYFCGAAGQPLGHLLRQVRNHPKHGPAFYDAVNDG